MKALNVLMMMAVLGSAAPLRAQSLEDNVADTYIRNSISHIKESNKGYMTRRASEQKTTALAQALARILGTEGLSPCGEVIDSKKEILDVDSDGIRCGWRNEYPDVSWKISSEELKGSGFRMIEGYLNQGDSITPGSIVTPEELSAANGMVWNYFKFDPSYQRDEQKKVQKLGETLASIYKRKKTMFSCSSPAGDDASNQPQIADGVMTCSSYPFGDAPRWILTAADFAGTDFAITMRGDYLVYWPKAGDGDYSLGALKRKGAYVSGAELVRADDNAGSLNHGPSSIGR